jgi:hypothetical protein
MNIDSKIPTMPNELLFAKKILFDKLNLRLSDFKFDKESREYEASTFRLDQKMVLYRRAKITPTKTGQFVTFWKRNQKKITEPFSDFDKFQFLIVAVINHENIGFFLFSQKVLIEQGILSTKQIEGKRAFRVYAPWDKAENKQSIKTKKWQSECFLNLSENKVDLDIGKKLLYSSLDSIN